MSRASTSRQAGATVLRLVPGGAPVGPVDPGGKRAPVVPIDRRLRLARRIHPSSGDRWDPEEG